MHTGCSRYTHSKLVDSSQCSTQMSHPIQFLLRQQSSVQILVRVHQWLVTMGPLAQTTPAYVTAARYEEPVPYTCARIAAPEQYNALKI